MQSPPWPDMQQSFAPVGKPKHPLVNAKSLFLISRFNKKTIKQFNPTLLNFFQ
jgi:hypothetical protein